MTFASAEQHLDEFLHSHEYSKDLLLGEVESVFGEPELVLAVGSLLAGLGNVRSDVDLMVVVDKEGLRDLPILSFPKDLMIDAEYYGTTDIANQIAIIRDLPWPPKGAVDQALWVRYTRALRSVTRMESGFPLHSTPEWRALLEDLKQDWLRERMVSFWRSEAFRFALSARWVFGDDPLLGCIRMGDAIWAALQAKTAMAGELFYHWKWLPEKLLALRDDSSLEIFRRTLRVSSSGAGDMALYAQMERDLTTLVGDELEMEFQLRLVRGTKLLATSEGTLVNLWNMDSLLVEGDLNPLDDKGLLARGELSTTPPEDIIALFRHGMCWLGVATRVEPEHSHG